MNDESAVRNDRLFTGHGRVGLLDVSTSGWWASPTNDTIGTILAFI